MKKGLKLKKEELENLYVKEGLSLSKIGEKYGCVGTNILYWLKKYGIERRPAYRKKIHIPKETLEDLYWKKKWTPARIAEKYGLANERTVRKKMEKYGLPRRSLSEANRSKFRAPFSFEKKEMAFLLGLRAGDFHVRRIRKNTVRCQTTTTHLAQVRLLERTLSKYGEIRMYYTTHSARADEWFIYVDLDESFDFLLEKPERIPEWALREDTYFYSFLAAYADCEGTFRICRSHGRSVRFIFGIKAGDKRILEQIAEKLIGLRYHPRHYFSVPRGTRGTFGQSNVDIYHLVLYPKRDVLRLSQHLLLHSRHDEKIWKMKCLLAHRQNNDWQTVSSSWQRIKEKIEKELLKNCSEKTPDREE